MSNSSNLCNLYEVKNDIVDIVTDEFSDNEDEDEEVNSIIETTLSEIYPYDDKDIKEARDLGMTVEDMFKMYQEINNYESDESDYLPEWPFDNRDVYCDEGFEESYFG
jgi:hypothetical protein|tara:strand:+ start:583 stop:906 length:324 start_codon:yes stop_codon:yes gene_type:complete